MLRKFGVEANLIDVLRFMVDQPTKIGESFYGRGQPMKQVRNLRVLGVVHKPFTPHINCSRALAKAEMFDAVFR